MSEAFDVLLPSELMVWLKRVGVFNIMFHWNSFLKFWVLATPWLKPVVIHLSDCLFICILSHLFIAANCLDYPFSLSTVGRSQSEVSRSMMVRCGLHRVHFVDLSPHQSVTPARWDSTWRTPGSSPHETTFPSSTSTPLWVNI